MASDVSETPSVYTLWTWFETNKKQVAWGGATLAVAGLVAGFFYWHQGVKAEAAGDAFSKVFVPLALAGGTRTENPSGYLEVADQYAKSPAGARALLFAGSGLFVAGKYSEAQAQFTKFTREYRDSPLAGQALLGVAACLDAQGKTNDALTAYRDLVDHHPTDPVYPQAKFALGNLYLAAGKPDEARRTFEELATRDPNGSIGNEAGMKLEQLRLDYPSLFQPPPAPVLTPAPAPATTSPSAEAPLITLPAPTGKTNQP